MALMGVANAFMWAPLGATATRNLPMSAAGAGSGIYNTTRQVGAVLGSAAIAALIESRLSANLPGVPQTVQSSGGTVKLPPQVADGFASAMSQSMLLPAAVLLLAVAAALAFARPTHAR